MRDFWLVRALPYNLQLILFKAGLLGQAFAVFHAMQRGAEWALRRVHSG